MTQRLRQNQGGYFGERIDIHSVLKDCVELARRHGWRIDEVPARPDLKLHFLRRPAKNPSRNVHISTGVHGDEPAGPLAVKRLLEENDWPEDTSLWICPCINPRGIANNTRENPDGIDLNRDYLHLESPEVRAHAEWIERQARFDLALCLHEDWESQGFYIYELMPKGSEALARRIVNAVAKVCVIDRSTEIDARTAEGGVVTGYPDPATRPRWPEAVYFFNRYATHSCTLEAPSDFPLQTRVEALTVGVRAALSK
jgi:hypothetical protein